MTQLTLSTVRVGSGGKRVENRDQNYMVPDTKSHKYEITTLILMTSFLGGGGQHHCTRPHTKINSERDTWNRQCYSVLINEHSDCIGNYHTFLLV